MYFDPSGHLLETDEEEFGKESDTYKICDDAGKRWADAEPGSQTRKDMEFIANEARRLARAGTPLVYAQDKIENELLANASTVRSTVKMYNSLPTLTSIGVSLDIRVWFASMVGEGRPWDYKRVSSWLLPYNKFKGQSTTGENAWKKGKLKFMYYDGMIISTAEFGNINYGYTGKAAGFSDQEIYFGGGVTHQATAAFRDDELHPEYWPTYFEEPADYEYIKYGINKYNASR